EKRNKFALTRKSGSNRHKNAARSGPAAKFWRRVRAGGPNRRTERYNLAKSAPTLGASPAAAQERRCRSGPRYFAGLSAAQEIRVDDAADATRQPIEFGHGHAGSIVCQDRRRARGFCWRFARRENFRSSFCGDSPQPHCRGSSGSKIRTKEGLLDESG